MRHRLIAALVCAFLSVSQGSAIVQAEPVPAQIAAHPHGAFIAEAAQSFGIPAPWIVAVMRAESAGDTGGEARVHSVVEIHRGRIDAQQRRLTAGRTDRWRLDDGQWRLAARDIAFDHPVVIDSNLNVFF